MTVSSSTTKNTYTGDGSLLVYDYAFRILNEAEILVQLKSSAGVLTTQTITTHYTVSGVGDAAGGSITFVTAPGATDTIVLTRNVDFKQETDYPENGNFPADTVETSLDKLTMMGQELSEGLGRSIKIDSAVAGFDATLPTPVANRIIGFDSAGTGLSLLSLASSSMLAVSGTTVNGIPAFDGVDTLTVASGFTYDGSTLSAPALQLGGSGATVSTVLDEDAMGSDSATALATQQSIKAYADSLVPASATDSVEGVIEIATKAEMETATSTALAVTPGRFQNHPGACKAWIEYNSVGTTAIRVSYNVTSLTDTAVGRQEFEITTDFSSGSYSAVGSAGASDTYGDRQVSCFDSAAGVCKALCGQTNTTNLFDCTYVSVALFGDQ